MKNSIQFRKYLIVSSTVALCLLAGATVSAQSQPSRMRLGVYDSRAVAVAYANSEEFQESLKATRADYQKAKTDKDQKRMKELEGRMKLQQRRMHEQGFSTGSVAGIMARIKDRLPGVADKARVRAVVSKWELNYQSPDAETVDVTDDLVALFHVSDKGKEWIKGVRSKPPLPLEEITDDLD
jgi:phosphoribosyl-AMP cyclohydrolase